MKEKLVFSPKSPLKCQEENGNQSKNAFRAKMQNSHNHNEDFKGKFRANEGYDKGESKSSRESGNLYKEDIKKTTKANLDDTFKNISKKTSVKSIINTTNNFDLKFQTNNNLKKYPGVEDLRKKLNRVKKRDNLIVSVPNTIHERASITEQDQPIQTDPKKSKTKTIQLVINLICKKPRDTHFEEKVKNNETCQLASLDLSFLDDINVDDIVESLNYEETANKLTNTNNQSLHKIGSSCEEKYSNNDNSTTGVKIGSTSLTNMSNTSEKPTETYPDQEGYNIITDDLNLLRSKNITTKVKCAMTILSSQTSTNQKQDTLDKINEYHRSKIQETQKERKKEIKREIIVLDEEQSTDILFLTNDKVKKENDAKIKTEITEVSLELLSNTQNRLTTQHFSYLNQDTFDTKLKDSQITKEIIKRIKNEMITEIIVLDDDDEPFTNSLISSNKEKQEKDLKGEIIVLDEEQLTDTFTLKPNTEIEKGNDTKIKTKIIEVNDATDESHSDMKNKLMTDIIVLDEDEHIFDSLINSSIQETSRHHIQNQNEINKNCVNRTENEPRKENNTNTSNTCHDNDTTHTSTVVNVPESKNLSIVPKANTSNTEIDASKNSSIGALPLSSISSFGTPKSNDENLAIEEEDTKVISNLNTKPEKNQKTEDPNQDESQNGNITQNDKNSVKSGKIKSKTDTIFVPADKYKATDDNFLDQTQKTLSVAKDGSNKKSTTNSKITPMGLAKTPCEETLLQNLKTRMLSYLGVNYDLGLLIRRGKYSTIFQCKDSKNKTTYAVKILNKEQDRYTLGIQKEIMLKDLQKDIPKNNQHFVYLINGFGVDGRWCFLMEYYPKTLKEIFHENKKCFHIDMVQELSRQLVSAVMVLRNKNIVHSAIKPGHVLINNTMKSLKLCGFDESRTVDQVVLLPNLGTPSYRAPELILGYSDGFSIDVWSTALVMYEMATGRKLFPGMFNNDILYKQMNLLGNIPFEIVQSSIFKDHHFHGTHFMRKCGYMGKDVTLISTFSRKSCVGPNIFYSYKNAFGKTSNYMENITAKVKLRKLVDLLIQMLVLDPQHRLPIEFVYADPFIFESYNDDCLLRRFKEFS
ncbi:hypothetical protein evm_010743 [Chilo suppressalis]|nr:hypothetical protein evm_010743 [Chilo suppressalis]